MIILCNNNCCRYATKSQTNSAAPGYQATTSPYDKTENPPANSGDYSTIDDVSQPQYQSLNVDTDNYTKLNNSQYTSLSTAGPYEILSTVAQQSQNTTPRDYVSHTKPVYDNVGFRQS